jgi:predicted HTH transcriptional regulator
MKFLFRNFGGLKADGLGAGRPPTHRDYSHFVRDSHIQVRMFADRLEVQNPGGLYGGVTVDELKEGQSTRNLLLVQLMEDVHLSPFT